MLTPKQSIQKMQGYCVPLYENSWDIKIDSNENNYGPSPKVINSLLECNQKNISFYPFYGELTQKIANYYNFNINNIKVTNGADEAIQSIIQTYIEPEDVLLTLDISFEMPNIYTQIQGGNIVKIPFEKKWNFPITNFLKELKNNNKIKVIYLASPNNPTGNIINENDLAEILKLSKNKAVIIDETYANYAGITYKDYVKKYDNVFIVRSFSKDFALAGLRLGCIISHEQNIDILKKVISPFSVNSYAMKAGIAALDDSDYFKTIKIEINKTKEDLKILFESLGFLVYESQANFILIDCKNKAEFIFNKLKNENISVKIFKKGHPLEGHLRITIPTKQGFEKIKSVLKIKPALVFDMDGVLIDARNSYRKAIEKTVEKYSGEKPDSNEIQSVKNLGGMNNDWDLTKYLLEKRGINIKYEEIVNTFQEIYWNDGNGLINNENILFDRDLFVKLSKDYNLSIFTGRLKKEAFFALKKFDVENIFLTIITTDDIPENKTKPDPYGLIKTKELIIASDYYYFGDTPDDIKSAKSAGYIAVGVLPPQDKSQALEKILKNTGADFVINSINELGKILEKKNEAVC